MTRQRIASAVALAIAVTVLAAATPAQAQIQKAGPQIFSGKFLIGFHPAGAQVRFDGSSIGGYKLVADFAGKLKDFDKLTLWLGGGFNYTLGTFGFAFSNHDLQMWAFVMLTLEKVLKIPLVPFVRAGLGGDILLYSINTGNLSGGAFVFRVGGGIHYYLIKQLGLGFETNFTAGPGFYPSGIIGGPAGTNVLFYGNWDFGFGARAHF